MPAACMGAPVFSLNIDANGKKKDIILSIKLSEDQSRMAKILLSSQNTKKRRAALSTK